MMMMMMRMMMVMMMMINDAYIKLVLKSKNNFNSLRDKEKKTFE
jgi:hypothetical protein